MDLISICDLEVFFRVGVPDDERARPQRLLITVDMEGDFKKAAAADDIGQTVDYAAVALRVAQFGEKRSWKLIETLASDLAAMVLEEFKPLTVSIEVKKFILPDSRHVSVRVTRG